MDRNKKIVKISIQGIIVNIVLVIFKAIVGFIANSISIILDAVNNLSDALSSIITIVGMALSGKRPDKKHPYGYGRIEYFSSVIIAIIVLFAGGTSLKESIDKILNGGDATYNIASLIIIFVAIFVKYFFGSYVKREGNKLNSSSLVASGVDAIGDSILSLSTFIGALISFIWHISLEGYIGVIISIMIIKTSLEILKDTIDDMIGIRADGELTKKLRKLIKSYNGVEGVYDLTLHNYGPNNIIGTAHIEVKDKMTAREIHKLTRNIVMDVYEKLGIVLTLGIYSSNDSKYNDMKKDITKIVSKYKTVLQLHGFYVEEDKNIVSFDLIFDFEELEPVKVKDEIVKEIKKKYPKYNYIVILDKDFSD
ncbi:MAG: cation transporter [Bacilli bacterium]|nr:cation transporter [Bacilli bacterium]